MARCGFIKRDLENGTATCTGCDKTVDIPLRIATMFCDANSSYQVDVAYRSLSEYIHKRNTSMTDTHLKNSIAWHFRHGNHIRAAALQKELAARPGVSNKRQYIDNEKLRKFCVNSKGA
jgi:hypothetical protein